MKATKDQACSRTIAFEAWCLSRRKVESDTTKIYLCMCACMLTCFSCVWLSATLWSVAHQAPLSMGFSRQEYWSGLPCLPPGDLSDPGIKPASLMSPALAGGFITTSATWEAVMVSSFHLIQLSVGRYQRSLSKGVMCVDVIVPSGMWSTLPPQISVGDRACWHHRCIRREQKRFITLIRDFLGGQGWAVFFIVTRR